MEMPLLNGVEVVIVRQKSGRQKQMNVDCELPAFLAFAYAKGWTERATDLIYECCQFFCSHTSLNPSQLEKLLAMKQLKIYMELENKKR